MADKVSLKLDSVTSLSDVIVLLKKSINKNLHVASVALYKETVKQYDLDKGYGVVRVAPIPIESGRTQYTQEAYILNDAQFTENELLLIVYTDTDFIGNLNTNRYGQAENTNPQYHSQINAVVVSTSSEVPIKSISVNHTQVQPVSENVNITVPTATSDLTNDSGFITSSDVSQELLRNITGYDATKTQTLKNINGTFTWIDD